MATAGAVREILVGAHEKQREVLQSSVASVATVATAATAATIAAVAPGVRSLAGARGGGAAVGWRRAWPRPGDHEVILPVPQVMKIF